MMSEKAIVFGGVMVRAILEGRKSETRRIIKDPKKPRYEVGDVLWVREPLEGRLVGKGVSLTKPTPSEIADPMFGTKVVAGYEADGRYCGNDKQDVDWRWQRNRLPGIFMPKKCCRLWLRVIGRRMERLWMMGEHCAVREGFSERIAESEEYGWHTALDQFRDYWNGLYKKHAEWQWESNPLVWVYRFERVEKA